MSENEQRPILTGEKKSSDLKMNSACSQASGGFPCPCSGWVVAEVIYSFRREFSSPAALPSVVSHLPWPAVSARPRLGLVLITRFFFPAGSASIFSCLWEGGGQISCEWKHRTDFCSTLTALWSEKEWGSPPAWAALRSEEGWFSDGHSQALCPPVVQRHLVEGLV